MKEILLKFPLASSTVHRELGQLRYNPASISADLSAYSRGEGAIASLVSVVGHTADAASFFAPSELLVDEHSAFATPLSYEVILSWLSPVAREIQSSRRDRTKQLLSDFLDWFNGIDAIDLRSPVKAGIALLWFVRMNPFTEGNGRIGRMVAEYALCQSAAPESIGIPLAGLIERDKANYFRQVRVAKSKTDITAWLSWFIQTCCVAQNEAVASLKLLVARSVWWDTTGRVVTDPIHATAINQVFQHAVQGHTQPLSTSWYSALTGVSATTAYRHLTDLIARGAIVRLPAGGRSTQYFPSCPTLLDQLGVSACRLHQSKLAADIERPGPISAKLNEALAGLASELTDCTRLSAVDALIGSQLLVKLLSMREKKFRGTPLTDSALVDKLKLLTVRR